MRYAVIAIALFLITACSTTSIAPQNVTAVSQDSTIINECQRLGTVAGSAMWTRAGAIDDMRANAYEQYGADTVAVTNTTATIGTTAQGVAYRCAD